MSTPGIFFSRLSTPGGYCSNCGTQMGKSIVCAGCGWADPVTKLTPPDMSTPGIFFPQHPDDLRRAELDRLITDRREADAFGTPEELAAARAAHEAAVRECWTDDTDSLPRPNTF